MEENKDKEIPRFTRDQVVEALKKLAARGLTNPDELDEIVDPEAMETNWMLDHWTAEESEKARRIGTPESDLEYDFSRSTIFVDAGFTDQLHLKEVADDWLMLDLEAAEGYGLTEWAAKIEAKIKEIETKLAQ